MEFIDITIHLYGQATCQHPVQPSSSKAKADQGFSPFHNRLYTTTGGVTPVGTVKTLNSKCKHTTECEPTLFCIYGACQCAKLHNWNGNSCVDKKTVNDTCTNSNECGEKHLCGERVCQCPVNFFWNGNQCILEKFVGHKCSSSIECAENLECRDASCQCSESDFWDNFKCSSTDNTYVLNSNVLMTNDLHKAGAEIYSNVPITLYGFLFKREVSGGFFVLPTRFVSVDYVIPSFTVYPSGISQSVFALSSVHSNTVIEINFKIKEGSVLYDNIPYSNNQTLTLVLNKYTTFQILHTSDFTGTRISASQPVVIVSGNRCNYINYKASCQPFIEMVLPTNQLDNFYVIPHLNYRLENTVRVITVNDTNIVVKNGNDRTTKELQSRDFIDYFHTTISYVSSESDVMVHIYPHELLRNHGDAFMMTIPGINQYLYDYDFMVPTDFESFISITVRTDAVDGFVLDGNFVNLKNIFSIVEEEHHFSSFSIPISSGSHQINHREKTRFGLWVYGNYTNYEAYGYPAGMAFKTFN
ncbi:unnamed protein product [Mytilus edulis]|uniref:IgGFc-binding protein N-terminal domain-containing protein n=1 Tax=Mytilus edulis TaxID=6550 RepID=A0A8S3TNM7_MYTED|nr:unnamed protein product [Mytilus edulis]